LANAVRFSHALREAYLIAGKNWLLAFLSGLADSFKCRLP
jgi:hypothetical protein